MHRLDESLKALVEQGQQQGYLTFTQVNDYLPDEAVNPEKLDHLLMSLEEIGLEIVNGEQPAAGKPQKKRGRGGKPRKKPHRRGKFTANRRSGADVSDANG